MAFDVKTFRTRALTSVVFVAIMLAGLLWNRWSFALLFTVVHFGCWYEYVRLLKKIPGSNLFRVVVGGFLYITVPIAAMIHLRFSVHFGTISTDDMLKVIPCGIIFSIWINDTMAYIVGSFIGKTPFSKISPKKTWEGTLGGMILCVVVITLIGWLSKLYTIKDWIIISALSAIFGTLGDLFESKLKRMAGVKNSGAIMPGHGGFLDRFDSLLIATPFVWLYAIYIFAF